MKYEEPNMEMLQIGEDVVTASGPLDPDGNSGLDQGDWEEFGNF